MIVIALDLRPSYLGFSVNHEAVLALLDAAGSQLLQLRRDGMEAVGLLDAEFTRSCNDCIALGK